ncbi:hypothetical protein F8388_011699 [Cannabis sativa]|uniref:CCHC-type domain-containing protein n=1 Tax=Cannabis sativa TaxID=3483 RepID=A0A7J6GXP2_CANSA|nr:hypothetical protein F8388_011699 [Cannabis sativa]
MASIITPSSPHKGKCFSCLETSVNLTPSDSSLKALASCCLFGKVVAPMVVEEVNVTDFVVKNWKIPVSVVAIVDEEKTSNVFKFGFESSDHRNWALDNGPWCVRGYTLLLQAWTPSSNGPIDFKFLRVWLQIHNLPHEYFSKANGSLLGGLAGKVVQVELEEDRPASWNKFLKVQVDVEVDKPLFSGCFFDVAPGVKKWVQMKFEKIGIFCYFCGRLGHQRRGCSLSSPVTANVDGIPFPMFGPWISIQSSYLTVFSGPSSVISRNSVSSAARNNGGTVLLLPESSGDRESGVQRSPPISSRRPRGAVIGTARTSANLGKTKHAVWQPKQRPFGVKKTASISGYGGVSVQMGKGKNSEALPILPSSILNSKSMAVVTPNASLGNLLTVNATGSCAIGPHKEVGELDVLNGSLGNGPAFNNVSNGLPLIECNGLLGGPNVDNLSKGGLVGPCAVGGSSIPFGPAPLSNDQGKQVEINAYLPTIPHGAQEHLNEDQALTQFFNAQEGLLHDLKHFGKLDLYEIRNIGGDIGVPASSEVNERTTPFKKRKFEASASLCSRPHKVPRKYPDVVRDFPWDTKKNENDLELEIDDPSEDSSSSPSCSGILKNPLVGSFVIDESVSMSVSAQQSTFAVGVLSDLYAFHRSTENSLCPYRTPAW